MKVVNESCQKNWHPSRPPRAGESAFINESRYNFMKLRMFTRFRCNLSQVAVFFREMSPDFHETKEEYWHSPNLIHRFRSTFAEMIEISEKNTFLTPEKQSSFRSPDFAV
jgi:hypothetical protein